jgi:CelD/BcsL family acetyltransferase involved in cellulose biosynthesis
MKTDADDTVRVKSERPAEAGEWADIAAGCPHATYFHLPAWLAAFAAAYPSMRVTTRMIEFEDGGRAVFPLLSRSRAGGVYTAHTTSAAGCYGGGISADPLGPGHSRGLLRWAQSTLPNLYWRINPLEPHAAVLTDAVTEPDSTELLSLTEYADAEVLKAHYRHSARKQINKGLRSGFEVRRAAVWEDWQAYHSLYQMRLDQWGKSASNRYPLALFRSFHEAGDPAIQLWLIFKDGKLVGGNLNFYHRRHAVEWHAVYDRDFFPSGVRDYLVHTIIEDARARGFEFYDFNPSGGHEGTRRFKQSFGSTSVPAGVIHRPNLVGKILALRKA